MSPDLSGAPDLDPVLTGQVSTVRPHRMAEISLKCGGDGTCCGRPEATAFGVNPQTYPNGDRLALRQLLVVSFWLLDPAPRAPSKGKGIFDFRFTAVPPLPARPAREALSSRPDHDRDTKPEVYPAWGVAVVAGTHPPT